MKKKVIEIYWDSDALANTIIVERKELNTLNDTELMDLRQDLINGLESFLDRVLAKWENEMKKRNREDDSHIGEA